MGGTLRDGVWTQQGHGTEKSAGRFERAESKWRNWVTADGRPGPTGEGGFPAVAGRYHLYIARACPWAHRAAIYRELKGLSSLITQSVTHWYMGDEGWTFDPADGVVPDSVNGKRCLHEVYTLADPHATGRVTVPVLWDKERRTIVSNESADIIRMMNSAWDAVGATPGDLCPPELVEEIDAINKFVYDTVNNGVYKAGFATTQDAYEEAVRPLFSSLDWLDERLSEKRWLCGDRLTEADWRLFTTLLRFDLVYHGHFKCNVRRIVDYRRLWPYTRALYQHRGVRGTVNVDHIKRHYYTSHKNVNPTQIVPVGPIIDFDLPV